MVLGEHKYKPLNDEWAEGFFDRRKKHSRRTDLERDAHIMFAVPNKLWANNPNKYDVWGLDGSNAPEVKELPEYGLPFQVVAYKGVIYKADKTGIFSLDEIEGMDPLDEKTISQFETVTDKKAFWMEKPTKAYIEWLQSESKHDIFSDSLNYTNPKTKLYKIREIYEKLDLGPEELKQVMFKLYNKIYANKIKSYTKDFNEFYEHRYHDNIDRIIKSEEARIKTKNKDPKKSKEALERYKTSELRLYNLMSMVEDQGYFNYNLDALRSKMNELKNSETGDIAIDFIRNDLVDDMGNDNDMLEIDEKKISERFNVMRGYYEEKSEVEYLSYLESMVVAS